MFLSFKLANTETRYCNSKRKCLAVVRNLGEVKRLVMGSPYPVMIHPCHRTALWKTNLRKGVSKKARISTWRDRLEEFNLKPVYKPLVDQYNSVADGPTEQNAYKIAPKSQGQNWRKVCYGHHNHPCILWLWIIWGRVSWAWKGWDVSYEGKL